MNVIVVSQNDINSSLNSSFNYKFRNSVNLAHKEIALSSLSMYYSWYNISAELGNNTFTFDWVVGVLATTYVVTIPDGMWEISDINNYLQQYFIDEGMYLINSAGEFVYYGEFIINPNIYSIDVITYPVPIALPATYTAPANFIGYPTQTFNPKFTFTTKFNEIIGYTAGFQTSLNTGVGTVLFYNSSTSPDIQPNSTLLIAVQNVANDYSINYSIIYSITPSGIGPGGIIVDKPPTLIFTPFIDGVYNQLTIRILTTDFKPIKIVDPNITMTFVIKDKKTIAS